MGLLCKSRAWAWPPSCSVATQALVTLPGKVSTTLQGVSSVNPAAYGNSDPRLGFDLFRTPPFSSEEDLDDDDLIRAHASPDLLQVLSSKSNRSSLGRSTTKSDTDWTEGSEIEDSDISPKPTGKLLSLKILLEILLTTVVLS